MERAVKRKIGKQIIVPPNAIGTVTHLNPKNKKDAKEIEMRREQAFGDYVWRQQNKVVSVKSINATKKRRAKNKVARRSRQINRKTA